jgi:hypothetical protein
MVFTLTLIGRLFLGMFLAGVVGFSIYSIGNFIALSIGSDTTDVLAVFLWTVGGGAGGFWGWMAVHGEWEENLVTFVLALVGAFAGAIVGLQLVIRGETAGEPIQIGTGIPRLAGMLSGTLIGANVLPSLRMVYLNMRGARL